MPSEKETISFLYAMLKRADLKTIDWNALATDVNIPTANAARMRYTRFKAQMDGDGPKANGFANSPKTPKTPKGKKTPTSGKGKPDSFAENDDSPTKADYRGVKCEQHDDEDSVRETKKRRLSALDGDNE